MKQVMIIGIIGLLVLIYAIQAFQLNSMKAKIADGQLSVNPLDSNIGASPNTDKKTATLPSNIANLPKMVGGC